MLTKILELIKYKPKHAVKMIKSNPDLWNWVLNHCDKNCINIKTQIYTAISGEKILCPCGSGIPRKLLSLKRGLSYCAPAARCSSARLAVSNKCKEAAKNWNKESAKNKRALTNKQKYGVENIGQTKIAIDAHKKFYSEPDKVTASILKAQNTCLKNNGVRNIALDPKTAKRRADTKRNNYFKKYGRFNEFQRHLSDSTFKILLDKEKFTELLLLKGRQELAKELKVAVTTISRYHNIFDLNIIHTNYSSYETELSSFVSNFGIGYQKDRNICKPKELDFYFPTKNLAIEINGLFYHSENQGKEKEYHYNKTQQCLDQNIHLIHIFEDEWINKKDICKNIILGCLNKITYRVPARKCQIVEMKNSEVKKFLIENHLQGYTVATRNIGLIYNNELIQLMTFKKPRYNKHIQWEIIRLATKIGIHVIGGSEKIWAYFVKTVNPESVVSYCDRRWFSGNIYNKLKFSKYYNGKPVYWYTDYISRFHRSKFTKKKCIDIVLKMRDNTKTKSELNSMTEKQITKEILGLDRIWDCGQDSWVWKKEQINSTLS